MSHTTIKANGKLLLAGEYFVLDGATAFAIPTRQGQHFDFTISPTKPAKIHWKSFDYKGKEWLKTTFSSDFEILDSTSTELSISLRKIFIAAQKLGAFFPEGEISVQSHLDFPRDWGLGTSSTLIFSIAKWLGVDAFKLLKASFGGSGYDIACAENETAIFYQIKDQQANWQPVLFDPPFRKNLGFVYLGQKQNSREGIQTYRQKGKAPHSLIQEISFLAKALSQQDTTEEFIKIIEKLEKLTGDWIQQKPIKGSLFTNFDGGIKSLGAWGGDFILAASPKGMVYIHDYFSRKGLSTILSFGDMILS